MFYHSKYFALIGLSLFASCFLLSCLNPEKKISHKDISIIPKPNKITMGKGSFTFNRNTKLLISDDNQLSIAHYLQKKFALSTGIDLQLLKNPSKVKNAITLNKDSHLSKEAYRLIINDDGVIITASNHSGFLYGIVSLFQLLPKEIEASSLQKNIKWIVPKLEIIDEPHFSWRGLMLDVSRHFFEKDYIMKTIDRMATHKMNVLHLHLIDDQGWRLQINKYPKLTDVGAWRKDREDLHWNARDVNRASDTVKYGGFYSQEDIKDIVAYASSMGIEVIPEIEMPAHVTSAIAAYPEFSCKKVPVEVPSGGVWPITDIYCAGKEETFKFLEEVLVEVMDLFPSKYIHIGGDEATKINWKTCTDCKRRMRVENLKNVEELQSYFIKRIEKFIHSKGKKLIGWDEILEGGLAPRATVMSWRGFKGGTEAANKGHDVVMTPVEYCYINFYQGPYETEPMAQGGYLPLHKVYKFDPVHKEISPKKAKHVLGGQANLWSEYVSTSSHSEYMIFPRLAAMSESLWTQKKNKSWPDFSARLMKMLERYRIQGINYSKSAFLISDKTTVDIDKKTIRLVLENEFEDSDIRYIVNGADISNNPKIYTQPIVLHKTTTITASLFKENKPIGRPFIKTIKFHKAMAKKVTYLKKYHKKYTGAGAVNLVDGLRGSKNFSDGKWQGWLDKDFAVVINLGQLTEINSVTLSALENQGPDIFFPISIEISTSNDGVHFTNNLTLKNPYKANPKAVLKDFQLDFKKKIQASYIKVKAKTLPKNPKPNRGVWLFIDEIIVE